MLPSLSYKCCSLQLYGLIYLLYVQYLLQHHKQAYPELEYQCDLPYLVFGLHKILKHIVHY